MTAHEQTWLHTGECVTLETRYAYFDDYNKVAKNKEQGAFIIITDEPAAGFRIGDNVKLACADTFFEKQNRSMVCKIRWIVRSAKRLGIQKNGGECLLLLREDQ